MASNTNIGRFILGNPICYLSNSMGTFEIAATTSGLGSIFRAPITGSITKIGACPSSVTGSPVMDVRLETVSSGTPTGTLVSTNTNVSWSGLVASTFVWSTLTSAASVTAGTYYACVVNGSTADASNKATMVKSIDPTNSKTPYSLTKTSSTWTVSGALPCLCAQYSDGTLVGGMFPLITANNFLQYNSGSTPREYSNYFIPKVALDCVGAVAVMTIGGSSATFDVVLYEGTTPVASATVSPVHIASGTGLIHIDFDGGAYTMKPGQAYRLSLKPTSGNSIIIQTFNFDSYSSQKQIVGDLYQSTYNGSTWTETTNKLVHIFPVCQAVGINKAGRGAGRGL